MTDEQQVVEEKRIAQQLKLAEWRRMRGELELFERYNITDGDRLADALENPGWGNYLITFGVILPMILFVIGLFVFLTVKAIAA